MTTSRNAHSAIALTFAAVSAAGAQASSTQTNKVATRMLPAAHATSTDTIMSVAAVRQLPNGNVLVNDQTRRRLIMLDKEMKLVGVVADSTTSTNNAYGVRPGGLLAYRGDSTLFVEPAGLSMLVIDPEGKIVRTMAAPRANDVGALLGLQGTPGFDSQGKLVYRAPFTMSGMRMPQPGQPFVPPTPPDTALLVRFDLATRKLDTLGSFKTPKINMSVTQDANGGMRVSSFSNPLPVVDEWAVMSDGKVAIVRGQDYHVDFFDADKKMTEGDKIPYEWQRMTDEDKTRFLDSAKVAIEAQQKAMRAAMASGANPATVMGPGGGGSVLGGGGGGMGEMMVMSMRGGPGGGGGGAPAAGPPQRITVGGPGGSTTNVEIPPVQMVPISDLSDYKPVFGTGSVRPDMDGRLWVRTIPTKVIAGTLYEVIDGNGKLVDRVQVPPNSTIAGFGKGGIVYLGVRDASGLKLQRISLKPTTVGDLK